MTSEREPGRHTHRQPAGQRETGALLSVDDATVCGVASGGEGHSMHKGVVHVLGWVDRLDELAVSVAEQVMLETGQLQAPTVHLLLDEFAQPYLGYVTCRPFYRCGDAADAVSAMGLVASMVGASRLVVTWENADLRTALQWPGADTEPRAMVVLDAGRADHGHTLRWHLMRLHAGPPAADGAPTCRPEWGPDQPPITARG